MAKKRIVIVDDDPSVLFYVAEILKVEGYAVYSASSGPEALEVTAAHEADLAILDVDMPGMDGFTLLNAMRERETHRLIPVIFLTVKDATADEMRGLRAGVVDYISKNVLNPERVDILRLRVRNFFALQENERLRGVLATIVSASHEINNPLMVVQGGVDLLDLKGWLCDKPDAREVVVRIANGCRKIRSVMERIAALTRFEIKPYLDGIEMLDLDAQISEEPR